MTSALPSQVFFKKLRSEVRLEQALQPDDLAGKDFRVMHRAPRLAEKIRLHKGDAEFPHFVFIDGDRRKCR